MTKRETADFYDAEMLAVYWETKPEIIKRLLPPPLKPTSAPIAYAFVAHYPKTNFGVTYNEGALFLTAEFDGVEGGYCLSMPVTDDQALVAGREVLGYPKKMADVYFKREKRIVEGWIERKGTRYYEVKAKLNGRLNAPDAMELFTGTIGDGSGIVSVTYNFKHFPSPDGKGFDYNPRLIKEEVLLRPKELKLGNAEITLRSSDSDPWGEIEVERILGAVYLKGDNSMKKGYVVAEVEQEKFFPYSFLKWDIDM